jgi:hypothetical protein
MLSLCCRRKQQKSLPNTSLENNNTHNALAAHYTVPDSLLSQLEKITGSFDLHITVSPSEIYKFNSYCVFNNIDIAYAVGTTGVYKQQLMTATYLQKTNGKEVVEKAIKLAKDMESHGIEIIRIKIESLAKNPGIEEFMQTPEYKNNKKYYFEFHYKVEINNPKEQALLDDLCNKFNASYATNFLSRNRKDPLISHRLRGKYENALLKREELRDAITKAGLKVLLDGTHYEFTIFDTNIALDDGFVPVPE